MLLKSLISISSYHCLALSYLLLSFLFFSGSYTVCGWPLVLTALAYATNPEMLMNQLQECMHFPIYGQQSGLCTASSHLPQHPPPSPPPLPPLLIYYYPPLIASMLAPLPPVPSKHTTTPLPLPQNAPRSSPPPCPLPPHFLTNPCSSF